MNKITARALDASINHWKRMRDGNRRNDEQPVDVDCALCKRFKDRIGVPIEEECNGCPIFQKTGRRYCDGTPYDRAADAFFDAPNGRKFKRAAQKMIDFLESLRGVKS